MVLVIPPAPAVLFCSEEPRESPVMMGVDLLCPNILLTSLGVLLLVGVLLQS